MRRDEPQNDLTRRGAPAVRLVPVETKCVSETVRTRRLAVIDRAIAEAAASGPDGQPSAARSADYLYGDDGLPA